MTQSGYGPFDADGRRIPPPSDRPPPERSRTKRPTWVIIGGAVLVAGVGILLVLLLRPQNRAGTSTAATGSTASSAPATAGASTPGRLPGGARVADRSTGGRARFDGSAQVALSWVQAMADRDFRTAYDLSCAGVRQAAIDAAAAGDPAQALGRSFFQKTLSGRGFAQGSLDSVIYNQEADSDIASFTLHLDSGEEFLLLVYVQGDGTVCDFI